MAHPEEIVMSLSKNGPAGRAGFVPWKLNSEKLNFTTGNDLDDDRDRSRTVYP